jgi:hypothetical protein
MRATTKSAIVAAAGASLAAAAWMTFPVFAADYGGASIPGESPCYAVFHELPDGRGIAIERQGPESVPRIRDMHYSDGRSLNSRVMSVTTGPAATLELYAANRYHFLMFEAGPDSRVNLPNPTMDSYVLRCAEPTPPQVYAPPPGYRR